jgi:DNA-binding NtrC family response regulator
MARLGDNENSLLVFQRAIDIAATAGALENAGHASLSLIEEHGADRLTELDAHAAYKRADEFLKGTQDAEDISRLRACAKIVMRRLMGIQISDSKFVLKKALRDYEARFIEAALSRSGGRISQAASMLGLSHQTLSNILKFRQKNLLEKRLPPTPRRKSIVRRDGRSRQNGTKFKSVLYVEDDKVLAKAVKKSLGREGFAVDVIANGISGLASLKRRKKYDVLIFDNEQQGINGISLARKARELEHRRATPIIVLSTDDVSTDAYRVGVNLFLQKPDDIAKLTANIKRLLSD